MVSKNRIRDRAKAFGLEVVAFGIRDLILPGEMKAILNRVTEAKREGPGRPHRQAPVSLPWTLIENGECPFFVSRLPRSRPYQDQSGPSDGWAQASQPSRVP